jgi:dTDP-4-dehydrorhamnose reductase
MIRVLLLGENGMLGSMVKKVLLDQGIEVVSTQKTGGVNGSIAFDAMSDDPMALLSSQEAFTHVVNAIGIIKPRINEADNGSRVTAIGVNGLFPHKLATACEQSGVKVIQIATDCVYSGTVGLYGESAPHDPTDVYGKSKSLGEVPSPNVMHLRASIIGPEVGRQTSLWEWVRSQAPGAEINGFTNHLWNGVTTYHFGRICAGVITSGEFHSGTCHVVPGDIVTKAALVRRDVRRELEWSICC